MALLPKTAEVVIIGGGVMGTSTAYHLAKKGCRQVVLLEKETFFGQGATGRCAGGFRHQFATEIDIRLSKHSIPMLERFSLEMGQEIGFNQCGYLFLLSREEDVLAFRENVELQRRLGVESVWLSAEEIAQLVPVIHLEGIAASTFCGQDGLADPSSVVQGYVKGARRLGATLLTETEALDIEVAGGRVRGVVTDRGRIQTPVVVNAAGPWAGQVGAMAGVDVFVKPVRRQMSVTTPIPQLPADFPMVIDFAQSLYFHREGPGILTGMSNPDEPPGFDQSVDLDWQIRHFEAATLRMPILAEAGILNSWAGLYEVSPDALPILGRVAELDGFICINGFSGHGFMHGPICGLLIAEEIVDGGAHTVDIKSLRIERFERREGLKEYVVV
ncbi:MAG: FAD-dependent oxidoreductase [Chloroflexi bacterium B3_Chlor]|nr:MAG: FAD-dependent oxidoreductase [Chloroflexi bacterium B3_Chlor]